MKFLIIFTLFTLTSLRVLALPTLPTDQNVKPLRLSQLIKRAPLPPAQDPFYTPPANWQNTAPGTVLKSRTVQVADEGTIPIAGVTAYQLLYRTNGALPNTPLVTVTTVLKPANSLGLQLVGFATAEDSDNTNCAPSYDYQTGSPPNENAIVAFEEYLVQGALALGWIVSSPDYEGPGSSFSAGRLSGHGVLDGLRAALNFGSTLGLSSGVKVAGFGYSGGAIATGWAAALQPSYAPELTSKLVGWSYGGTPANISGTLSYLDGTLFAGFGVGGIQGLSTAYPTIAQFIQQYATAAGKAALAKAASQCAQDDITDFAFQKIESTQFSTVGAQLLYNPTVMNVTNQNILGAVASETPSVPVYIYHALHDEIIPINNTDTMVANYCQNGIKSLYYVRDTGVAEHASMEILGYPSALQFLLDRFNGVPATPGCQTVNTAIAPFAPNALGTPLIPILTNLLSVLNTKIGMDDGILKASIQAKVTT